MTYRAAKSTIWSVALPAAAALLGMSVLGSSSARSADTPAAAAASQVLKDGTIAYVLASLLAGISGILIAPVTTIFYDSGFLIGLKAFVGAIIGAMASYPLTAAGAIFVGLLESFASFWSSDFKDAIVFGVLIPVLLWRSLGFRESEEETEE